VSEPMSVVPAKKSTLATVPSVSDAVALIVMLAGAVKVAPLAGAVSVIGAGINTSYQNLRRGSAALTAAGCSIGLM